MITYQVEQWSDVWRELEPMWMDHWKEIALDQTQIMLDVDHAAYTQYAESNSLHVVTVRNGEQVIGYHISIIRPHLHYKQSLSGFTDVYYLDPPHRKGLVGYRLFQFVEKTLQARGVERVFTGTKLHLDMGKLFLRLGWTETERLFTKYIGEK